VSDIEARVKKVIMDKISVKEEKIVPSASFVDDLGADSLDLVELIMGFEDEFDPLKIPDTDSEKIRTVQEACEYIAARI